MMRMRSFSASERINEISTPNISGMVSMGCSFCLVSLGSVLSGTSDSKPTS